MREYETIFITKTSLPESQLTELNSRLGSMLEKHEGHLFFSRSMGKRKLAYPIAKELSGLYTHINYTAGSKFVPEMERKFKLDENVIRFLTVVKNETVDIEARTAEVAARGEGVSVQDKKPEPFVTDKAAAPKVREVEKAATPKTTETEKTAVKEEAAEKKTDTDNDESKKEA